MNIFVCFKKSALRLATEITSSQSIHVRNLSGVKNTFQFTDLAINCKSKQNTNNNDGSFVFGKTFSDHMLEIEWTHEKGWGKPIICPMHELKLHPAAKVLHYAQELFEGMKAFRSQNGKILLFRPDLNMKRMLQTADRTSLPLFDGKELLQCIKKLVSIDKRWVPEAPGCSLYIRPTFIGIEPSLGVGASKKALLYVITGPVGSYFQGGEKGVSLLADPNFVRAWPGGVGNKKMGCNYAPTIYVQNKAEEQNIHQVLWLYGDDHQLAEVGTMNIFIYLKNKDGELELVTPPLDGTILPGVIRQSLLDMARKLNEFKVSERHITMKEVLVAKKENRLFEIFGSGTACVISPVGSITYMGEKFTIPTLESENSLHSRFLNTLLDIQYGRISSEWSVPVE